jgi:hypothetical protein
MTPKRIAGEVINPTTIAPDRESWVYGSPVAGVNHS